MKVHAERLKLESELAPSECQNVRACYPIKVPESEFQTEMDDEEKSGEEISPVEEFRETSVEESINKELPVTCKPYSLRSKGAVEEESWVMKKAI